MICDILYVIAYNKYKIQYTIYIQLIIIYNNNNIQYVMNEVVIG